MNERKYKTTPRDEAYFTARVKHWQNALHLGDWKVEVYCAPMDDSAQCEMWHNAHGAHIKLAETFAHQPTKHFLDRLALHEVAHVLLCDLKRLIFERSVSDAQAETAEHAVIRRLEMALK